MNPQTVAFSTLAVGAPFMDPATGQVLYQKLPAGVVYSGNPAQAVGVAPVANSGNLYQYAGTYQVIPTSSTVNY
jgi:hypothetical protein